MKDLSICFDYFKTPEFDIATADLVLVEDIVMPNGFVYKKGKKYFTRPEIADIIGYFNYQVYLKDSAHTGYLIDLPTKKECADIVQIFGNKDGSYHSYHLASRIGMGFYGSIGIITTMEEYNLAPENFIYSQAIGYGVTGNYLCGSVSTYPGHAQMLCLNSCGGPTFIDDVFDNGAKTGCSVRLIRRHQ